MCFLYKNYVNILLRNFTITHVPRMDLLTNNNDKNDVFHYRCKNCNKMYKTIDKLKILYDIFNNANGTI